MISRTEYVMAYPATTSCNSAPGALEFGADGGDRDIDDEDVEERHELGGEDEETRPTWHSCAARTAGADRLPGDLWPASRARAELEQRWESSGGSTTERKITTAGR